MEMNSTGQITFNLRRAEGLKGGDLGAVSN